MTRVGPEFMVHSMRVRGRILSVWCASTAYLLLSALVSTRTAGAANHLELTRMPVLQMLRSRSVIITWHASEVSFGRVEIGNVELGRRAFLSSTAGSVHEVFVDGLEPGTTYHYRVVICPLSDLGGPQKGACDGVSTQEFDFRTAPEDDSVAIRVGVFGDAGARTTAQFLVRDLLEEMAPDIVLVTGDLVYPFGTDDTYQRNFFDVYADLFSVSCVFPAIGNHDAFAGDDSFSRQFILPADNEENVETYYSFDFGSGHFVALDSNRSFAQDSPQNRWLVRDLSRNRKPWTIVYFHHPIYSTGPHGDDRDKPPRRHALTPILEEFAVDLVLTGHDHLYERTFPVRRGVVRDGWQQDRYISPRGTVYVVTGGGGQILYRHRTSGDLRYSAAFASAHHAVEIALTRDELSLRSQGLEGSVLDSFVIRKNEPRPPFSFLRGDSDLGMSIALSDAIRTLEHLFKEQPLECPAAADWDADGKLSLMDAVGVLVYLFVEGPPAPSPFPECGVAALEQDAWCLRTPCPGPPPDA